MKIRIDNDFVFVWAIERNSLPEDLATVLEAKLTATVFGKAIDVPYEVVDTNKIRVEFTPAILTITGQYNLKFTYTLPDLSLSDAERKCAVDVDAFTIVERTAQADTISEMATTSDIAIGLQGKSAYQSWLEEGNVGTEQDYLNWLRQPATDISLIVEANETSRENAETLRQTNSQTAVQNAGDAATLANEKAVLANTAAENADDARLAIQSDLALKADQADLVQLAGDIVQVETDLLQEVTALEQEQIQGGVYDVSSHNYGAVFESLSTLLGSTNLSTLIPTSVRHGGMSIRFIHGSVPNFDNKYAQYRLMADSWSINTDDWAIAEEGVYVENTEFVYVKTDNDGKILYGVKPDGKFYFGAGCPPQVVEYITSVLGTFDAADYADIKTLLGSLIDGDTLAALLNDKLDAQGLDSDALATVQAVENTEYIQATIDSDNKILEGITSEGVKQINLPIETPTHEVSYNNNPEWVDVKTDKDGKIIEGIKKDGTKVINNIESKTIDDIQSEINKLQYFHPIHEHGCIISFIDDDSGQYVPEIWDEIVGRTGIRFGIACITGYMSGEVPGTGAYVQMSLQDLQRFYNAGHEVYSHSWSHQSFRTATLDTIEEQCWKSRDWINANGFVRNSDCIVYPAGMHSAEKKEKTAVVRRHYRFGVATTEETIGVNPEPLEPLFITRCNADPNTLDYLKAKVDDAVSQHKLLVVLTHAYELMGIGTTSLSTDKSVNIQRIVDLIDYAKSQGATILPLEEAIHQIYGWNQY